MHFRVDRFTHYKMVNTLYSKYGVISDPASVFSLVNAVCLCSVVLKTLFLGFELIRTDSDEAESLMCIYVVFVKGFLCFYRLKVFILF